MFGCPLMECSCGAYFCWNCCKSPPDCDGGCNSQDEEDQAENEPHVFVNEETISVEIRNQMEMIVDGTEGSDIQDEEDHGGVALGASVNEEFGLGSNHVDSTDKSGRLVDGTRSVGDQDDVGHDSGDPSTEKPPPALDQTEREDSILTLKGPKPATKDSEKPQVDDVNTAAPKDQEFASDNLNEETILPVEGTRHADPVTLPGGVLDLERLRRTSNPDIVNESSLQTLQNLLRQIDAESRQTGFDSSIARPTTDGPIDLDAGGSGRWANGSENFGAEPGDLPHASRVQVWYCNHTPHIVALNWPVTGEYLGDPTLMECNRCVSRVRPMYILEQDEKEVKKGDTREEEDREVNGEEEPSSPKTKRRKLSDSDCAAAPDDPLASSSATAVEPHYSPRNKACDLDQCNPRDGTSEHTRPDQAWICWRCALIVCRKCKDRYIDELSYEAEDR
jgi:hypothetical protein